MTIARIAAALALLAVLAWRRRQAAERRIERLVSQALGETRR